MSEEHQLPSDSDDDDEDYVPDGAAHEPLSEIESESDVESSADEENDENKKVMTNRGKKRNMGAQSKGKKRKTTLSKCDEEQDKDKNKKEEKKELTEEEEKKRADSLWADFMKDTGTLPKPKPQHSANQAKEKSPPLIGPKVEEKVKITKIFEFAGEEVKIEKEVAVDSAEARLSLSSAENANKTMDTPAPTGRGRGRGRGIKRGGLVGISSVLAQVGKKAKISTLEKSKLDWDNFKKQENLEEEISTHNKGKDGYLERQDFLQRTDLRQFEIEKQLRNANRRSTR